MKKRALLLSSLLLLLAGAVPACASSLLYAFSSGDILLTNPRQTPTYGIGRMDFDSETGEITPTVLISGDTRQHALGEFTRNNSRYIYDSKVQKPNESVTYCDIYDASRGVDEPLATDLTLSVTPNPTASCDLTLAPSADGYIYAINGTTLTRYDMLNWSGTVSTTLESGYNVYSLVGLTNNANVLYVWSSQRNNIGANGSYIPAKSDIYIYDRDTLEKLADFKFVRTGLDTTKKLPDDEAYKPEPGRGLVDISNTSTDKAVVLVVYEDNETDSAQIIRIDEITLSYDFIVKTTDINGWNVDNESPIPDNKGGFYFGCYSGDANAEPGGNTTKECTVYHWNKTKGLTKTTIENAQTTADLVLKEGMYAGNIVIFAYTGEAVQIGSQKDYKMRNYIWDGVKNNVIGPIYDSNNDTGVGVELEKPFGDGDKGIYYMMESVIASEDADALMHWNSSEGSKMVTHSAMKLEVEEPPSDGNNGFYFVMTNLLSNFNLNSQEFSLLYRWEMNCAIYYIVLYYRTYCK